MRIKYKYNPEVHKLNVNSKAGRFCQKLTDCFLFRMFLVCLILELSCNIFPTKIRNVFWFISIQIYEINLFRGILYI